MIPTHRLVIEDPTTHQQVNVGWFDAQHDIMEITTPLNRLSIAQLVIKCQAFKDEYRGRVNNILINEL